MTDNLGDWKVTRTRILCHEPCGGEDRIRRSYVCKFGPKGTLQCFGCGVLVPESIRDIFVLGDLGIGFWDESWESEKMARMRNFEKLNHGTVVKPPSSNG